MCRAEANQPISYSGTVTASYNPNQSWVPELMTRSLFTRIAFVLALSPLLVGCNLLQSLTGPGDSDIEYRVSGTAVRVSLKYETKNGTSENSSATLPWTLSRQAKKDDLLYVSAQIIEGDGTVTAEIHKGGKLLNSSTSTGAGAIATASGTLK